MNGDDAKKLSSMLANLHNAVGMAALVLATVDTAITREGVSLVNLSDTPYETPSRHVTTKEVRTFLWDNRQNPVVDEVDAVVWSAWSEEDKKTMIGLGKLIPVADEGKYNADQIVPLREV